LRWQRFPRSLERGPIEAPGGMAVEGGWVYFRVHSNAAPLKQASTRASTRQRGDFRVHSNAAPLKR